MAELCPPWPTKPTAGLMLKLRITYHDPIPPDPPRWNTHEYAAGGMKYPESDEWGGQTEAIWRHFMILPLVLKAPPRYYSPYKDPHFSRHLIIEKQKLSVWLKILPGGETANVAVKLESTGFYGRDLPPPLWITVYQTDEIIEWAPLEKIQTYYWNLQEYAPWLSFCRMEVKPIPPPTKKSW